ncbi:hypothetical protein Tco_1288105 [Tanacetum coccineum]
MVQRPPKSKPKRRPKQRMKGGIELAKNVYSCSICNGLGHNISTCPEKELVSKSDGISRRAVKKKKEIDTFLSSDDSIPPGIDSDDYDLEGDFLEDLLNDDSLSRPEYETFHFDRFNIPSSPRPPEKPQNDDGICFDTQPDLGDVAVKVMENISDNSSRELRVHVPNDLPT